MKIYTYTDGEGQRLNILVDQLPFPTAVIDSNGRVWEPEDEPELWSAVLAEVLSGHFKIECEDLPDESL